MKALRRFLAMAVVAGLVMTGTTLARPLAANAASTQTVKVLSYNIRSTYDWTNLRCKIVANLVAKKSDVLLIQEGKPDRGELARIMANKATKPSGALLCKSHTPYRLAKATPAAYDWNKDKVPPTYGAHIYYNPATTTLIKAEERPLGTMMGKYKKAYYNNYKWSKGKYYAMALFEDKKTKHRYVAISVHTQCQSCVKNKSARVTHTAAAMRSLVSRAQAFGGSRTPVILGGDLNERKTRGDKVHKALANRKLKDSRPASHRTPSVTGDVTAIYDYIYFRGERAGTKLTPKKAIASRFATNKAGGSDHRAISTTITFSRSK